jgi:hypothetical protein
MSEIVITFRNVLSLNQACKFVVGLLDDNGYLTNITFEPDLEFEVVAGEANFFFNEDSEREEALVEETDIDLGIATEDDEVLATEADLSFRGRYIQPGALGNLVIRATQGSVSNNISLWVVPPPIFPSAYDANQALTQLLPPNCYTTDPESAVYAKNFATARVTADIYSTAISPTFFNIFPPFATSKNWEQMLNNNYPWQDSFDYGMVVQILNNMRIYSTNLYDCSFLISWYIYARIGKNHFVYIEETAQPLGWILGVSRLGVNTILNEPEFPNRVIVHVLTNLLPTDFIADLNGFITKALPANVSFTLQLDTSFTPYGLVLHIRDTYEEDPRLYKQFAIRYDKEAVYNATALVSPYNPIFITRYYVLPNSRTFYEPFNYNPVILSAFAVYVYQDLTFIQDVTYDSMFSSDNPTVMSLNFNEMNINTTGVANITATYLDQQDTVTYTAESAGTPWILGTSTLGVDTYLG